MKIQYSLKSIVIPSLCAIAFGILSASAQSKEKKQPTASHPDKHDASDQVQIYTEIIEISAIQYAAIMSEPVHSTNHDDLRNKLLKQVKKNEAKLILNQTLHSRSGERATSESIQEYIYQTEFEPAEAYPYFSKEAAPTTKVLPPTATAFETRNLGLILEIEATIVKKDSKTIDLTYCPEFAKHTGFSNFGEWVTKEASVKLQMPMFYTIRTSTNLTVYDNQFTLVATHSPEKDGVIDNSRKWLCFVKANILKTHK